LEEPVITCNDPETYLQNENKNINWMKPDDYDNPIYDILEEDETSDSDIEYAEHRMDYDY
jgi:hypothetical protein